ncbi:DEAD/DEAH box helicase [Adhaeretor mobilis]|uniref:ATP-dependent DNA helicase RecQ n=1 Tax=Adhaeretor mobilis TaxID=1930276 RepID=A0A517MZN0_9BACT|nr:DEAD/DEAH box helicase [Adhaeretor mobilis]QDT00340.1 ATP-dependent DNA helicase RecQ [Adhaeretor mobilis]
MGNSSLKKRQANPKLTGMDSFHIATSTWLAEAFGEPTTIQRQAWPELAARKNALLLAPTGSGKTLAAFLAAIDRLMFGEPPKTEQPSIRILYISPLKALGVDVDRNLRAPLAGIRTVAGRLGHEFHEPTVAVRSGDTSAKERQQIARHPPDILITTPESLYLMLTSKAREVLRSVETVIVDEIHAVAATKRGTHLFLTLERLEHLLRDETDKQAGHSLASSPLQRIGLSATQRPLEEIARLLGGGEASADPEKSPQARPVEIIDAGERKHLEITVEVPVEDMAAMSQPTDVQTGPTSAGPSIASIWPAIHPRLVELIGAHRSTMIFVNSRRLAERLAASINELADQEIALAHHGSLARAQRSEIEDRLKRGDLPAIVATSSLELGIDMGAVDLVIQIEAPPSVASGLQRIGRAGHHLGAKSEGVIFPKYRGDLLACSAAVANMLTGQVESTRYPRNPLDVLAQQIVAMVALEPCPVDELYATVRCAAPFHDLPKSLFDGVLDLLSGRYPSDEFSELRPRINWDRLAGVISPRKGSQRIAVLNGGTIPDRGLYGVYLAAGDEGGARVGELDEEMVFETRPGDVFLLGASSWRVIDITRDRVLVAPAPGEPGRMPFWRGDGPGRPLDFGRAIGKQTRQLGELSDNAAQEKLRDESGLDQLAAKNLVRYVRDQADSTVELPTDKTIVVESFLDEIGDWRVVILSPFGSRVHAPWALAVIGRLREETGLEIDFTWADDGIVLRLPESEKLPNLDTLFPDPQLVEDELVKHLGGSSLFAARFRENAARALLLPRRQPQKRTPLWLQRRKSADLLKVAARYERFPILLETYRECLRDVFDVAGLKQILGEVQRQTIRVHTVENASASPFASSLLFNYTANFLYNGDAPLAERRAQALALDQVQLRELLGAADFRELLDADAIESLELQLQRLDEPRVRDIDSLQGLLLYVGDLSEAEIAQRTSPEASVEDQEKWITELLSLRRIISVKIAGETRLVAAEDASRLRDALGVVPPPGLPEAFLEVGDDPLTDLVSRYARTHGPFRTNDVAARLGLSEAVAKLALEKLVERDRVIAGEFLPGGTGTEWCDTGVLRQIKRRSLAKLRKQVEPVEAEQLARFLPVWQGVTRPRRGLDGLLDAIEQLQGAPLAASELETSILPTRIIDFAQSDLDELFNAGEVVWRGIESVGPRDGRIGLYLADSLPLLAPRAEPLAESTGTPAIEEEIHELLQTRGALFFDEMASQLGGFRNDALAALWSLVWKGHVTNDTIAPLRSLASGGKKKSTGRRGQRSRFRSRRQTRLAGSEGRWSLVKYGNEDSAPSPTERQTAITEILVRRYGILTRPSIDRESVEGGFSALYPVLRAMEESGRVRRGYFVEGLGGAQFASPGADDSIRQPAKEKDNAETIPLVLSAVDPANAYGAMLKWPATRSPDAQPQRVSGAQVILDEGVLLGFLNPQAGSLTTFKAGDATEQVARHERLAVALESQAEDRPLLLKKIDGGEPANSPLARLLLQHGFHATHSGYQHRGGELRDKSRSESRRYPRGESDA